MTLHSPKPYLFGGALIALAAMQTSFAQNNALSLSPSSVINAASAAPSAMGNGAGNLADDPLAGSTQNLAAASTASSAVLNEKVNLEYRNAPLTDVLRSIADSARFNMAIAPSAIEKTTDVTIRLSNVTYEVALRTILDLFKLGANVENGVLQIDTAENLSKARELKAATKMQVWKTEPTRRLVWQVNHAEAAKLKDLLSSLLRGFASDPRFSVQADERSNKIIIEGVADALVQARSLLEALDKRKQQVLIEARIVEASSELSRTLSVTWGTRFGLDAQRGLSSGVIFPNSITGSIGGAGAVGAPAPQFGSGGRGDTQLGSMGFSLGSINGLINIDGILRAYETERLANVIASPRIVVQDNNTASIEESTETTRPTQFGERPLKVKLSLEVKPQIASDNTLQLEINVNRDTPTNPATDIVQGKTSRVAKTKMIVQNGETAVIGGLYQTIKLKGQGRIPLLGRLPIIGFLFRTNDEESSRSELMALITPRILPMDARASDFNASTPSVGGNAAAGASNVLPLTNNGGSTNSGGANAQATQDGGGGEEFSNGAGNSGGGGNAGFNSSGGNSSFNSGSNLSSNGTGGNAGGDVGLNSGGDVGLNSGGDVGLNSGGDAGLDAGGANAVPPINNSGGDSLNGNGAPPINNGGGEANNANIEF